jgi:hypothetical protein
MGANKTFQQKGDRGRLLGETDEFKRLRRAVEKAHGDPERAVRNVNVCRLYGVNRLDPLPGVVRCATLALRCDGRLSALPDRARKDSR